MMRLKCFSLASLWMLLALPLRAGIQGSTDYLVTNESADGGGQRVSSPDYVGDGSFGGGNLVSSTDYTLRGGYVASLNNAPLALTNYIIKISTNSTFKVQIGMVMVDPDGDTLTFVGLQNPTTLNGTVSTDGKWVFYRPAQNYAGNDSFDFTAMDSEGDSATGTIFAQVGQTTPSVQPTLNLIGIALDTTPGSAAATLRFGGLPGATYEIQYTDNLIPPVIWKNLGSATVTNGVLTIVDPSAGAVGQRYYRTVYQTQ